MNLAIFDIDGTLTETDHIDEICFVQALTDAHGITGISTDWAGYPHTTDSAITFHIFETKLNRRPEEAELQKFKTHFVRLLENYQNSDSSHFAEIDGAALMLQRLNEEPDWRVAIASGSWRAAATLKLKAARIPVDDYPAAFADDGLSRQEILRAAISQARMVYKQQHFTRVVSIGDGVWDVRTARDLGFPFVGVGSGERERKLRDEGASHVIKDFGDYSQLLRFLGEANIPSNYLS